MPRNRDHVSAQFNAKSKPKLVKRRNPARSEQEARRTLNPYFYDKNKNLYKLTINSVKGVNNTYQFGKSKPTSSSSRGARGRDSSWQTDPRQDRRSANAKKMRINAQGKEHHHREPFYKARPLFNQKPMRTRIKRWDRYARMGKYFGDVAGNYIGLTRQRHNSKDPDSVHRKQERLDKATKNPKPNPNRSNLKPRIRGKSVQNTGKLRTVPRALGSSYQAAYTNFTQQGPGKYLELMKGKPSLINAINTINNTSRGKEIATFGGFFATP